MSILLLGADEVSPIKRLLYGLGADTITHWDMRKKSSSCSKSIPQKTACLVMLTNYLNHNAMKKYKKEAKKMGIPIVCAKRNITSVEEEYQKKMGLHKCQTCKLAKQCPRSSIK